MSETMSKLLGIGTKGGLKAAMHAGGPMAVDMFMPPTLPPTGTPTP